MRYEYAMYKVPPKHAHFRKRRIVSRYRNQIERVRAEWCIDGREHTHVGKTNVMGGRRGALGSTRARVRFVTTPFTTAEWSEKRLGTA